MKHHPTRNLTGDRDHAHSSRHRHRGGQATEGGRRTHEHGHHVGTHDGHIRHSHDRMNATHLHNATRHLEAQHSGGPLGGSLGFGHYSTEGLPHPHSRKDSPGV